MNTTVCKRRIELLAYCEPFIIRFQSRALRREVRYGITCGLTQRLVNSRPRVFQLPRYKAQTHSGFVKENVVRCQL